jgi:hypothetical protein
MILTSMAACLAQTLQLLGHPMTVVVLGVIKEMHRVKILPHSNGVLRFPIPGQ